MLKICDTTLRDAHQSLMATRLSMDDMLPILETIDTCGYYSIEMWGGATFDSCLRYLNEDPWDRLRTIRKICKNSKLQMLLRGQNVLGYKHYPDDVVRAFVDKSVQNGIDIIRIFDALNDPRNLEVATDQTKKSGALAQLAISYTTSPFHTAEEYVKLAVRYRDMGADSICIKDMAGLLKPYAAYELVKSIKEKVDLPLEIHSHSTSGLASMMYMKAVEAGADIIDTAISSFALGTSQPPIEPLKAALEEAGIEINLNDDKLSAIAEYFQGIKTKYLESGLISQKVLGVDIKALRYQVPGGMLSNLVSQLKSQNAENKLSEVLEEVPRVRQDMGYPPLVTPTSQIVGTQAVMNVIAGERYKLVSNEVKDYVRGKYGKPACPISDEVIKKIIGNDKPIDHRPADDLEPMMDRFKTDIADYYEKEEDVLSYGQFPQIAMEFFKKRRAKTQNIDEANSDLAHKLHYI